MYEYKIIGWFKKTLNVNDESSNIGSLPHSPHSLIYFSKMNINIRENSLHFKKKLAHKRAFNVQAEINVNIHCYSP